MNYKLLFYSSLTAFSNIVLALVFSKFLNNQNHAQFVQYQTFAAICFTVFTGAFNYRVLQIDFSLIYSKFSLGRRIIRSYLVRLAPGLIFFLIFYFVRAIINGKFEMLLFYVLFLLSILRNVYQIVFIVVFEQWAKGIRLVSLDFFIKGATLFLWYFFGASFELMLCFFCIIELFFVLYLGGLPKFKMLVRVDLFKFFKNRFVCSRKSKANSLIIYVLTQSIFQNFDRLIFSTFLTSYINVFSISVMSMGRLSAAINQILESYFRPMIIRGAKNDRAKHIVVKWCFIIGIVFILNYFIISIISTSIMDFYSITNGVRFLYLFLPLIIFPFNIVFVFEKYFVYSGNMRALGKVNGLYILHMLVVISALFVFRNIFFYIYFCTAWLILIILLISFSFKVKLFLSR